MVHKKNLTHTYKKKQKPTRSIKKTSRKKYKGRNTRRNYTGGSSSYGNTNQSFNEEDDVDDGDDDIAPRSRTAEPSGSSFDSFADIENDVDDDIEDDVDDDIEYDSDIDVCHQPIISEIGGAINYISSNLPRKYNLILELKGKRPRDSILKPILKNINKKIKALKSKRDKKIKRRKSIRSPNVIRRLYTSLETRKKRKEAIGEEIRTLNETIDELVLKRESFKDGYDIYIQLIKDYYNLTKRCEYNIKQKNGLLLDNNNKVYDHSPDVAKEVLNEEEMDDINALLDASKRI